jgi:hypothetical protein
LMRQFSLLSGIESKNNDVSAYLKTTTLGRLPLFMEMDGGTVFWLQ